ncbi:oxidoreductase [Bryobacterales bacterium F-183]|nr:oxidoreductase [Bryobacterales bacterium F-183]
MFLQGKTALITGSSNGIGAEAAVKFAAEGAKVLIHYRSREADAQSVLDRVRAAGGDGEIFYGDFSTSQGVHTFLDSLGDRKVDILINNAGWLVQRAPFLDFSEDLWNSVVMLNFTSVFLITQRLLPGMVERGEGYVVNISSVAARNGGGIGAIAYASSKAGLSAMTKGLAKEFAPKGIRVNGVSPGTIDTNFHKVFSTETMLNNVRNATPAGRLGDSDETADVILFLCSPAARFIHGQMIEVNGGFLMV